MDQLTGASSVIFGMSAAWVATIIFALTYVLIIAERINRSIIALIGAGLMIISGVLTQEKAVRGIDFNTIALLTGMMMLVSISRRCGMFEYLAIWLAKQGRAQPWATLAMLFRRDCGRVGVPRQCDDGPADRAGDARGHPRARDTG